MRVTGLGADSAFMWCLFPADPETGRRSRAGGAAVVIDDPGAASAAFAAWRGGV